MLSWAHLPLFGSLIWPRPMSPLTSTHVTFVMNTLQEYPSNNGAKRSTLCTIVHNAASCAQRRSVVHNPVLYPGGGGQHRSHKLRQTDGPLVQKSVIRSEPPLSMTGRWWIYFFVWLSIEDYYKKSVFYFQIPSSNFASILKVAIHSKVKSFSNF